MAVNAHMPAARFMRASLLVILLAAAAVDAVKTIPRKLSKTVHRRGSSSRSPSTRRKLAQAGLTPFDAGYQPMYLRHANVHDLGYTATQGELQNACGDPRVEAPSYQHFVVSYTAVPTGQSTPSCQIDTDLITSYYQSYDNSPFLNALGQAITATAKPQNGATIAEPPFNVRLCGIQQAQYSFQCPTLKPRDWKQNAIANARAARKGLPLPKPLQASEPANYRTYFEAIITVSGLNVDTFTSPKALSPIIQQETFQLLQQKYGSAFACSYNVTVNIDPFAASPYTSEVTYKTSIVEAILKPDGYDFPGNFYTDAQGMPNYLGPLVQAYEYDLVKFEVTNAVPCQNASDMMGGGMRRRKLDPSDSEDYQGDGNCMGQATHFHGIAFYEPYSYNDGTVGFDQGAILPGEKYTYIFNAYPAGSSWYHGHYMRAQMQGNKGPYIIQKRPCDDPYAGTYDAELSLTLDAANPWYLEYEPKVRALRHTTGVEDWANFYGTEGNYPYPANPFGSPNMILTSYGGEPSSDQPWAGVFFNGVGRAIPLNYSSDYMGTTSNSWGDPAGDYYSVRVEKGKTYRLRIVNISGEWGYRFYIEGHPFYIISISGGDIRPVKIDPPQPGQPFNMNGIELQPSERYDILFTANNTDKDAFFINVQSADGCYKDVAVLLYDDAEITPTVRAAADDIKRDRVCDADCYTEDGCNMYLQFSVDQNSAMVQSIEPVGIPPVNPANKIIPFVIREGDMSFFINDQVIPVFDPPLYLQHYYSNNNISAMQAPDYLSQYSLSVDEVVDWCIIGYPDDRHPMHLHADRYWFIGAGTGDLQDCVNFSGYQEGTPTFWGDTANTPFPIEEGVIAGWIRIRTKITTVGAWPFHCHIAYHMDQGLLVAVLVGVDQSWPIPPLNLPNGIYDDY